MFDIGATVICVNATFPPGTRDVFNALPVKGTAYTVRDIVPGQTWNRKPTCAVLLEELVNRPNVHGIEPGFNPTRFVEAEDVMETTEAEVALRHPV